MGLLLLLLCCVFVLTSIITKTGLRSKGAFLCSPLVPAFGDDHEELQWEGGKSFYAHIQFAKVTLDT